MNDHKLDRIFKEAAEQKEFLFSVEAWNEVEVQMEALDPAEVDQIFQESAESLNFTPGPEAWSSFVQSTGGQSGAGLFGQFAAKFGLQVVLPLATSVVLLQSDVVREKEFEASPNIPTQEIMWSEPEVEEMDQIEIIAVEGVDQEELVSDPTTLVIDEKQTESGDDLGLGSEEKTHAEVTTNGKIPLAEASKVDIEANEADDVLAISDDKEEESTSTGNEPDQASQDMVMEEEGSSGSNAGDPTQVSGNEGNGDPVAVSDSEENMSEEPINDQEETSDLSYEEPQEEVGGRIPSNTETEVTISDTPEEDGPMNPGEISEADALSTTNYFNEGSKRQDRFEFGIGLGLRTLRLQDQPSSYAQWKMSPELLLHVGLRLNDRHSLEAEIRGFENTGSFEGVEFISQSYGFGPVNERRQVFASPSLQFEIPIRWRYRIDERSFASLGLFYAHQLPMELRILDSFEEWYATEIVSDETTTGYIEGFRYQNFGASASYQYRLHPRWILMLDGSYYLLDRDMMNSPAIPNQPWSIGLSIRYSIDR